jgi:hypothetical protein
VHEQQLGIDLKPPIAYIGTDRKLQVKGGDDMQYKFYELDLKVTNVVVIHLDRRANVQLMDAINYQNYKNGRQYRYTGGHAIKSPVRLRPSHSGRWYVVIDLGQGRGLLKHRVEII